MKDKLVKTGHKRGYYLRRKIGFGVVASIALFSVIAIPTYIIKEKASLADDSTSDIEEQIEDEEILSYTEE